MPMHRKWNVRIVSRRAEDEEEEETLVTSIDWSHAKFSADQGKALTKVEICGPWETEVGGREKNPSAIVYAFPFRLTSSTSNDEGTRQLAVHIFRNWSKRSFLRSDDIALIKGQATLIFCLSLWIYMRKRTDDISIGTVDFSSLSMRDLYGFSSF